MSIVITASFRKLKVKLSKQFLLQIILYSCPGSLSSQENWHWFSLFYQSRQISDPPPIQSSHKFLLRVIWSHLELGTGLWFRVLRPYKLGQVLSNNLGLNNARGCCWVENGVFNILWVRRSQTQGVWYWGGLWGLGKEVECVSLISIWTIAQVHPPTLMPPWQPGQPSSEFIVFCKRLWWDGGGGDIYGKKCPKGLLWCLWKYIWEPVWRIIKGFISSCNIAKSTGRLWLKWWPRRQTVCIFVLIFYRDTGNVQSLFCHRINLPVFQADFKCFWKCNSICSLWESESHIWEGHGGVCWQFTYITPLRKSSWLKWLSFGRTCSDLWHKQRLIYFIGSVSDAVLG